jgi:hypothetical protein
MKLELVRKNARFLTKGFAMTKIANKILMHLQTEASATPVYTVRDFLDWAGHLRC